MADLSLGDALALRNVGDGYDGFGGGWFWIVILFLFAFMGNGFGGYNRNGESPLLSDEFIKRDIFNTNQNVSNTGCQTQRDILESRYTTQLGFANLQASQQNCCCETNRNIDSVRYDNLLIAKDAQMQLADCCCKLEAQGLANTQRIIDMMQQDKIDQLRQQVYTTNEALNSANLANQIINSIIPRPAPAYPSCSPFVPSYYGFNNGCGCGNSF